MADVTLSARGVWETAVGCFNEGDFDRTVALCEPIAARFPDQQRIHSLLGVAELKRGNAQGAVPHLMRSVSLDHDDAVAWLWLGEAFEVLGEFDPATDACLQSISADRESPWSHLKLFEILTEKPRGRSSTMAVMNRWAKAYMDSREIDEAVRLFDRRFGEVDKPLPNLFLALSRITMVIGMLEESVDAFTRATVPAGEAKGSEMLKREYRDLTGIYEKMKIARICSRMMAKFVAGIIGERSELRILDAACGTGLMGALLESRGRHIAGIDLSSDMVAEAERKGVYDDLRTGDITVDLPQCGGPFDLITCCDALYHLSDLGGFFAGAASCLAPGGILAFGVDPCTDRWEVRATELGGFAHSRRYLRRLAADSGLAEVSIVIDEHRGYPGFYCAFEKPGGG